MAPTYEDLLGTRFRRESVFSEELDNIVRDGTLKLPDRSAWQLYTSPEMQNFREMKRLEAQQEGQADARLVQEEVLEAQRGSAPGPAVDLGFVANAVSRMDGMSGVLRQQMEGLERAHRLHTEGIAHQSRAEVERLAEEIRREHERNRIAREFQSSLVDTMHVHTKRMEELVAQASSRVDVSVPQADTSTTNAHMAELQANLQRQQEGFQAAAAEMIRENREAFARMAAQQGLTASEMQQTVARAIANAQPTVIDARSVAIDARSVNVDARSVGIDSRTVNVDSRVDARVQQMVDNRSVANVVNVQGGPPPPPPAAGAIRTGTKRKEPVYPCPFSKAGAPPPKKTIAALTDAQAASSAPPPPPPLPALPAPPLPRAKSAPRGRPLAIEDRPARARTRSVRPTDEEKAAMAEVRAAARAAKEDEKTRRFLDREEKKMNRQIARDALEYEQRKAREERGRLVASTRGRRAEPTRNRSQGSEPPPQSMNRPGRSTSRPRIDPEDLVAAVEAALGKPKPKATPKAKAKATVAEVTAMAEEKFRGRAKAKAKKDTIRRVPVVKDAKRAGRLKGRAPLAAIAA